MREVENKRLLGVDNVTLNAACDPGKRVGFQGALALKYGRAWNRPINDLGGGFPRLKLRAPGRLGMRWFWPGDR